MKDIELIIPMLREFLNERGLNEVKIELTLKDVPFDVLDKTYPDNDTEYVDTILAKSKRKFKRHKSDTITLESKYF